MPATKILWGQILVVLATVIATIWSATQWTAWRLGYQPQLGRPWAEIGGVHLYPPPAFFGWWFSYDAYAPDIFVEGAFIAASGGFAAIAAEAIARYRRAFRAPRSATRCTSIRR